MSPFIKSVYLEVESAMIRVIVYEKEIKNLSVTFNNYNKYLYRDVPEEVFHLFLVEAVSIGNLFNKEIKNKYQVTKLD